MTGSFRERFGELVGKPVESVVVDLDNFDLFKALYQDDRSMIDDAKRIEYYISYRFLNLGPDDTFIDIAAQDCPFAFFVRDHFGAQAYRQDLYYMKKGVHGADIGGNAAKIPLSSGAVSKIALHNSLEHFEDDSDIDFFKEAQRLLRPGGLLLVVPLFIGDKYAIETDAGWVDEDGVKHLWGIGAQFGRWYDLPHFKSRILDNAPQMDVTVYHVDNAAGIDPKIHPYFVIFERRDG